MTINIAMTTPAGMVALHAAAEGLPFARQPVPEAAATFGAPPTDTAVSRRCHLGWFSDPVKRVGKRLLESAAEEEQWLLEARRKSRRRLVFDAPAPAAAEGPVAAEEACARALVARAPLAGVDKSRSTEDEERAVWGLHHDSARGLGMICYRGRWSGVYSDPIAPGAGRGGRHLRVSAMQKPVAAGPRPSRGRSILGARPRAPRFRWGSDGPEGDHVPFRVRALACARAFPRPSRIVEISPRAPSNSSISCAAPVQHGSRPPMVP